VRQILQMRPELKPYVAWMIQQHDMAVMEQQAQQAYIAAGPPGGGGGGGLAMQNSNNESGSPRDVPNGTNQQPNGNQGPQ
jgi:hypothetical protein